MTPMEVVEALGHIVATTPGWSDETVEEYAAQLEDLNDPAALVKACKSIARAWSSPFRPPISTILDSYDRESLFTKALDPARVHCDGSGWSWENGGHLEPCRRCQPALAAVWDHEDKLSRYRSGTPIEHLDVGVERVGGHLRFIDGTRPPVCQVAPDRPEEIPSVAAGIELAWTAYSTLREEEGGRPRRRHFNELIGRT